MKKLRTFECSSCLRKCERIVEDDVKAVKCECGNESTKQLSAPIFAGNSCGNNASWGN